MRQPDFSPGRLPPEWRNAICAAQNRIIPERPIPEGRVKSTTHPASTLYEHSSELRTLIGRLKRERIGKGLSLGDIARVTQQARSAFSRLESGQFDNPTLNTLYRYARALGWHIRLSLDPLTDEQMAEVAPNGPGRR